MYAEVRDKVKAAEDVHQEVYVLRGGFSLFQAMYHVSLLVLPVPPHLPAPATHDPAQRERWADSCLIARRAQP